MIPDIEQILTGYMKGEYTLSGAVDLMQRHIDLAGYDINKQLERRELFKQVALAVISNQYTSLQSTSELTAIAEKATEAILSAAEQFAAKQSADEFAKKGEG